MLVSHHDCVVTAYERLARAESRRRLGGIVSDRETMAEEIQRLRRELHQTATELRKATTSKRRLEEVVRKRDSELERLITRREATAAPTPSRSRREGEGERAPSTPGAGGEKNLIRALRRRVAELEAEREREGEKERKEAHRCRSQRVGEMERQLAMYYERSRALVDRVTRLERELAYYRGTSSKHPGSPPETARTERSDLDSARQRYYGTAPPPVSPPSLSLSVSDEGEDREREAEREAEREVLTEPMVTLSHKKKRGREAAPLDTPAPGVPGRARGADVTPQGVAVHMPHTPDTVVHRAKPVLREEGERDSAKPDLESDFRIDMEGEEDVPLSESEAEAEEDKASREYDQTSPYTPCTPPEDTDTEEAQEKGRRKQPVMSLNLDPNKGLADDGRPALNYQALTHRSIDSEAEREAEREKEREAEREREVEKERQFELQREREREKEREKEREQELQRQREAEREAAEKRDMERLAQEREREAEKERETIARLESARRRQSLSATMGVGQRGEREREREAPQAMLSTMPNPTVTDTPDTQTGSVPSPGPLSKEGSVSSTSGSGGDYAFGTINKATDYGETSDRERDPVFGAVYDSGVDESEGSGGDAPAPTSTTHHRHKSGSTPLLADPVASPSGSASEGMDTLPRDKRTLHVMERTESCASINDSPREALQLMVPTSLNPSEFSALQPAPVGTPKFPIFQEGGHASVA
ncbi:hypothetical protein KIPB_010879, partial [Kipferlia bialata]|eukprot:g10879.t1